MIANHRDSKTSRTDRSQTMQDLPTRCRRLVAAMQRLNFGVIESLPVRGGEPHLDPPVRLIREHKLGGENGPRPESSLEDFVLKAEVLELLAEIKRLGDGVIDRIEVRHGLPFRLVITEPPAI